MRPFFQHVNRFYLTSSPQALSLLADYMSSIPPERRRLRNKLGNYMLFLQNPHRRSSFHHLETDDPNPRIEIPSVFAVNGFSFMIKMGLSRRHCLWTDEPLQWTVLP